MGWDDIVENSEGKGGYTKFEPGVAQLVHIIGEPEAVRRHWIKGTKTPVNCVGQGCQMCRDGEKLDRKWNVKVFNLTNNQEEVMQAGVSVFGSIKAIRKALGGSLRDIDMNIVREGTGLNTKYSVVSLPTKFKPEMIVETPAEEAPF